MLAVGGWDGRVILLESVGWSVESVIEPVWYVPSPRSDCPCGLSTRNDADYVL
jgi:hypothetical protein